MKKTIIGKSGNLEINKYGLIKISSGPYAYISSKSFEDLEDDEIAYISEAYLDEFHEDVYYQKEEILKKCDECTKGQMISICRERLKVIGKYFNEEQVSFIAEDIYNSLEWACFSTYLDEFDVDAYLVDYFIEHKDTISFKKIGYFNDIFDVDELKYKGADEVVNAMLEGKKHFYKVEEEYWQDSLEYVDFAISSNGEYLVIWDCENDNEDNFIDVYQINK